MRAPIIIGIALHTAVAYADVELKNDSFESGQQAIFELGFFQNEMGAARFDAPEAGRTLLKVQTIFGGSTATRMIRINVYDDTAGTNNPGSVVYSGDFSLTGSDSAMQELATTDMNVVVPERFRVAVEFVSCPKNPCGTPTIARDDGASAADRNFIFDVTQGWIPSSSFFNGDWIIRAFVSGTGGPGPGGDGGNPTGGACDGNGDCPVGEFCDTTAGACTFECRTDPDCGDGTCNSLGQCVDGGGGGGGCCRTDRGGTDIGALVLGGLFGMMLRRRRRCA